MNRRWMLPFLFVFVVILLAVGVGPSRITTAQGPERLLHSLDTADQVPEIPTDFAATTTVNANNVEFVGRIAVPANDVVVVGNYAYVVDGDTGLHIINVSNPAAPWEVGSHDTPGAAAGIAVAGNYAYVADFDGLRIFNIANPATPWEVGSHDTLADAWDVAVAGNYVYLANEHEGLRIINVADPSVPTEVGFYYSDYLSIIAVAVAGNYVYAAGIGADLIILNVANPAAPTLTNTLFGQANLGSDITVAGNYAYVTSDLAFDPDERLSIINVTNPAAPTDAGYYEMPWYASGVAVAGDYAYVANRDYGLRIIDVANPAEPTEADSYDTPGQARGVALAGGYVYVADGDGLLILRFNGAEPTYSISGRALDQAGAAIAGANVCTQNGLCDTTDSSGDYSFNNLAAGSYTLTATKSGYTFTPSSRAVTLPPSATGVNFTGSHIDLSIDSVFPVQVLEGQNLVKNKATAVKAVIRKTGNDAVNNISVRLNLGGSFATTRFYVVDPSNMNAQYQLVEDNMTHPLNFASNEHTKTIYFFSDGLTPTESSYQASVAVDYLGTITETDETNNTITSPSVPVYNLKWSGGLFPNLYVHYFRTDWESTSLTDFDSYYQTSNNFLRDVYPVAGQSFTPNKSSIYIGDTTPFRLSDGKLNSSELGRWVRSTLLQMRIFHPAADRFIATVPAGWFETNTTDEITTAVGVAYPAMRELVISEARMTSRPNGPSVAAHEIGHSYGLNLDCEDYDENCDDVPDRYGSLASSGLWVEKRILIQIPEVRNVYTFMGAYADEEYWIDANSYSKLLDEHKTSAAFGLNEAASANQAILAVGTFDISGSVTLENWYTLPEAELSILPPGPYAFEYQAADGGVLYQQSFDMSFNFLETTISESSFVFTLPYVPGTARIVIKHNNIPQAQKEISTNAPIVTLLSPNGGEQISGQVTISWSGSDADSDMLSYSIAFSRDNGGSWEPIAGDLLTTNYTWDVSKLPPGTQYLIKVVVTDGINTGQDTSDIPFTIDDNHIYLPINLRNP